VDAGEDALRLAAVSASLLSVLGDAPHGLLIHEARLLRGDTFLLAHDEVVSALEPTEVVTCRVVRGDYAPLVVLPSLVGAKVGFRTPTNDHIYVVIYRARPSVLRSRMIRTVTELEV